MHASRLFRDFLTLVLVVGRFVAPASAQDAPVELSGGYQLISLEPGQDQNTQTLRTGWYLDLAGNLTRVFAIVGQVGGNYRSRDLFGNELRFSLHEFMGGIRASGRANTTVVPFGQALIGPVRANLSLLGERVSVTKFALQFGGGVNWRLTQRIGIRVGADYLRIFNEQEGRDIGDLSGGDEGGHALRFVAGAVLPLAIR
jgi:outer membrane protein with beta-barrel domain